MGEATIRKPLMSGHCAHFPLDTENGRRSHERCQRNGGGQRANPQKMFQPCPCPCHFDAEADLYECEGCGGVIMAAPDWPLDEDDDVRYTHVDFTLNDNGEVVAGDGRALGEECEGRVSRNEPKRVERDCSRCGDEFVPAGRERICPDCRAAEIAEADEEVDSLLADLTDEDEEIDDLLAGLDLDD